MYKGQKQICTVLRDGALPSQFAPSFRNAKVDRKSKTILSVDNCAMIAHAKFNFIRVGQK